MHREELLNFYRFGVDRSMLSRDNLIRVYKILMLGFPIETPLKHMTFDRLVLEGQFFLHLVELVN